MSNIRFPQSPIVDKAGSLNREWLLWLQNPQFSTVSFASAITVPNGGTGQSSLTNHGVVLGASTSAVNVTAAGATGTVLKGVTGADPVFAAVAGSEVTGAALTKTDDTNVTLTLGGTPATALLRASSITAGWSGQLAVARGGTGLATLTAHAVYVGNGTSAPTALSVGATNQFLKGATGADPAWGTATLASADFANQGTTTTVLHGNAAGNPSFAAVDLANDVTGTLTVGKGGTGVATLTTAYGVLCAGTTATGAVQTLAGLGNSGDVLTSAGAGALPTFSPPAAGTSAATQAQQEAATATTVYVSPGRQQYHPASSKAWALFGVTGNILASYNVSSVGDTGTGVATINLTVAFSSANHTANISTIFDTGGTAATTQVPNFDNTAFAAGAFVAVNRKVSDGTAVDPSAWSFVAFGDQA